MIHLANDKPYTSKDAALLLYKARSLVQDAGVVIRDTRISTKYIEFDASLPDSVEISSVLQNLRTIAPAATFEHIVERHIKKEEAIRQAIELFNEEKYWGTHELLESVWKNVSGKEKELVNGIILVAAAFVHDEKDESEICISILKRAMKKFNSSTTSLYHGINVERIVSLVSEIIRSGKIERFTI